MTHGAVRVRLDVTDVQASVLLRAAGARRKAWNWALAKIKANADQWAAEATYGIERTDRVRPLNYFALGKLWTAERPEVAPWAGEHSTWTFRYALRDAANAHQAFLAGKRRFPRFKARRRDRARFTVRDGLALEVGRVRLAKYGWVRISSACPQQAKLRRLLRRGQAVLQHITVSRSSDGHWYATVSYTREARVPTEQCTASAGPVVGVDRGVKTTAVVATTEGRVVSQLPASRALRDRLRQVKHLQRTVSRTKKGSVNRRRAVARLGRAHARAAAVRAEALHTFTAELAREHGVVVVEDLATKNLMANRALAAAIGDQGWAELARQLTYKTARHGGQLIVADRWFASSKTCSACGAVRPKLTLAERTYHCGNDSCGHVADRDVNAAANLAAWGEHTLGLCPCVTQDGDRHPGGPTAGSSRHACGGRVSAATGQVAAVLPGEAGTSGPRLGVA
ncbi:RNA-guided endonuclease InsQ/TnpB family protein [Blastococcus saxobsidens]|uniref:Transposase, IS605 OrfB family n=1 Tax=Blastococcus saxobsidens (strain DD2) TaxID=1146883 RepID=H6RTS3_BLASD|nr:RNA-guided endonuclease TnpB family protein [Blastococcus saxobsidens]CCG03133.1 Transposase, IS605 OrfB family [Blastococcus saxobsidens DD2]